MLLATPLENKAIVSGQFNYIHPDASAVFDLTTKAKSSDTLTHEIDQHTVKIVDARTLPKVPSLKSQGFSLDKNSYSVSNYFNEHSILNELRPQIAKYLLALTGGKNAMVFDHTIRSVEDNINREEKRSPIKTVHNDYTDNSAANRLQLELKKQGISQDSFSQYQFINTWIPLVDKVSDSPLAFADISTFSDQNAHIMQVAYPDRMGEIEAFSYNKSHQWYFYPDMTSAEQVNFKVFDSNPKTHIKRVPHSAFTLPNHDVVTAKRASIEVRTIILFE